MDILKRNWASSPCLSHLSTQTKYQDMDTETKVTILKSWAIEFIGCAITAEIIFAMLLL